MDALQLANTALAIDVYKKLNEQNTNKNILFAPPCISAPLALALKGAKNETAKQMEQVLHLEKVKDVDFGYQTTELGFSKISDKCSFKMVKRLYAEKSLDITKDFIDCTKKPYPLMLEVVDFKENAQETVQQINKSCTELTKGKIENILNDGSVDDQTKLVLLGAAAFSGMWLKKFNECETKEVPFRTSKTESKPVQMMQLESRCNMGYIKDMKTLVLDLPCENKALGIIILLPQDIEDDSTGLEQLEKELTSEKFIHWTNPSMMANTKVKVCLPKFKLEESVDLKPILVSLGLKDACDAEVADFTGMTECKGVALSHACHKSSLEISEEGAEEPDTGRERVLMHKDEFNADHPFMLALRLNNTRSLLMMGKFCSP
ncbi:serpin B5 [Ambystoma mexicanum]|uniref:serpin B5 n=1 Tax=Ambystoma mexicanum TaxID=8296 RepID=UPI0037E94452